MFKKIAVTVALLGAIFALSACSSSPPASEVVSHNLTAQADNFEIVRSIQFINGFTGERILSIEGRCSINDQVNQLEVTCKIGPNEFKKEFLGMPAGANVFYFSDQIGTAPADEFHFKRVYRPETLIPDIDINTSGG